jgi:hypothetical protein
VRVKFANTETEGILTRLSDSSEKHRENAPEKPSANVLSDLKGHGSAVNGTAMLSNVSFTILVRRPGFTAHPGYISWEEYLENQRRLEANVAWGEGEGSGAAKAGTALLSGLLRCGRCGRKLQVVYSGNGGRVPRYGCRGDRGNRGSSSCLTSMNSVKGGIP